MKNILKLFILLFVTLAIPMVQLSAASCKINCFTNETKNQQLEHECCDKKQEKSSNETKKQNCHEIGNMCGEKLVVALKFNKVTVFHKPSIRLILSSQVNNQLKNKTHLIIQSSLLKPKYPTYLVQQKFLI
jgi:hypothetical protein